MEGLPSLQAKPKDCFAQQGADTSAYAGASGTREYYGPPPRADWRPLAKKSVIFPGLARIDRAARMGIGSAGPSAGCAGPLADPTRCAENSVQDED